MPLLLDRRFDGVGGIEAIADLEKLQDALFGGHRRDALCARFDRPLPPDMIFADGMVQRIPIRRYRPRKIHTRTVLLYLHGGGFVVGSLESHHAICAEIADFVGAELVSVDYRLAPEYRWPAQTDDGFAVLKHLLSANNKVVLIGDSAGGNLAAGLALRARDEDLSGIVGQVLIYPALGGDLDAGSYVEMAKAVGADMQGPFDLGHEDPCPWPTLRLSCAFASEAICLAATQGCRDAPLFDPVFPGFAAFSKNLIIFSSPTQGKPSEKRLNLEITSCRMAWGRCAIGCGAHRTSAGRRPGGLRATGLAPL
ncbi:alpha/beta hydrolase [Rhizobium sp.]|uniref:alpha/beta hydrolase n=1 Tax=Rhizobium sp. TaxID=391 RepID=UPI003981AE11